MMTSPENIISLTDFKRNAADVVKRIKDDKTAAVLTVNGTASVVVLDAHEYQRIAKDAEMGSMMRGIEDGLKSMEEKRGIPLETAFGMLKQDLILAMKRQG
ncbi:MAG: type II toxin-antitoxin system Phd/YefM family antitoxin [Alphaproteobacteria bacterium]|nr:type II toxin-antitoxin system Phd/YefM family antitoxin [Alphaproteobacteria bacterium]